MNDFLATEDRALLERNGLADFDALWARQLDAVDEPHTSRGGWSSVFRLELEGRGFYLKRQSNYLTRTLDRPVGRANLCPASFRNISRLSGKRAIQALAARLFMRSAKLPGENRALLLTPALEGLEDP